MVVLTELMRVRELVAIAVIAALPAIPGCSSPATPRGERPTARPASVAPSILSRVPATTPYVYAQLDPIPDGYLDAWLESKRKAYRLLVKELASLRKRGSQVIDRLGGDMRLSLAIAEELGKHASRDGLAALGFDPRGRFVIYGDGLYPVLRLEISDEARMRATIRRVLLRAQLTSKPALEYRQGDKKIQAWNVGDSVAGSGIDVVVAVDGGQLIAAMTPIGDDQPEFVARLFRAPDGPSLDRTGTLAELTRRHQLAGAGIGFADLQRTALEVAKLTKTEVACRDELTDLTRPLPRIVIGTMEMSQRRLSLRAVLETSASLRMALERSQVPVPGLSPSVAKRFGFALGVGIDVRAFADYLRPHLSDLSERRFECEGLKQITGLAGSLHRALDELLSSQMRSILGAVLVINRFDISEGPDGIAGLAMIGARNPERALAVLADIVPEARALKPTPGGPTVPVELSAFGLQGIHLAMGRSALGLSVGGDKTARALRALVNQEPASGMPLFVLHSRGALWNDMRKLTDPGLGLDPTDLARAMVEADNTTYESLSSVATVTREGIVVDLSVAYPP